MTCPTEKEKESEKDKMKRKTCVAIKKLLSDISECEAKSTEEERKTCLKSVI